MAKVYYTYLWLREDGTPYYIGKGSGNRAFVKRSHRCHPPPENRILIQEFPDEDSAFEAEIFLIGYYGREDLGLGRLLNLTDGGENPPKARKGRKMTPEQKRRMLEIVTDPSPETRHKMREAKLGKPGNNLGRRWKFSKPRSIAACMQITERQLGRKFLPETIAKMSAARKGKPSWNKGLSGGTWSPARRMAQIVRSFSRSQSSQQLQAPAVSA